MEDEYTDENDPRCGGLFQPVQSLSQAMRMAAANFAINRDIVALVLNSFGDSNFCSAEREHCVQHIILGGVMRGECNSRGASLTPQQLAEESERNAALAKKQFEEFVEYRLQKIRNTETAWWKGMSEFSQKLEDMDMNLHCDLEQLLRDELRRANYETRRNPHMKPSDRASPKLDSGDAETFKNLVRRKTASEECEKEQQHKRKLRQIWSAHEERAYFFKQLQRPAEVLAADDKHFAYLFLYAFSHSRDVQRMVCAEYCNARPFAARQLHPARKCAFVSCLPAIFEHYFLRHIDRKHIVVLARFLHANSFVPLLTREELKIAAPESCS